jgi:hypothetical protein
MRVEDIAEVGLDDERRVFVRPASGDFEHIYRAAMEIYWDRSAGRLSHPARKGWSPVQWFRQILAAMAEEYGVRLELTDRTVWSNVSVDLRSQFEARSEMP